MSAALEAADLRDILKAVGLVAYPADAFDDWDEEWEGPEPPKEADDHSLAQVWRRIEAKLQERKP